jgi:hypothetical protein
MEGQSSAVEELKRESTAKIEALSITFTEQMSEIVGERFI